MLLCTYLIWYLDILKYESSIFTNCGQKLLISSTQRLSNYYCNFSKSSTPTAQILHYTLAPCYQEKIKIGPLQPWNTTKWRTVWMLLWMDIFIVRLTQKTTKTREFHFMTSPSFYLPWNMVEKSTLATLWIERRRGWKKKLKSCWSAWIFCYVWVKSLSLTSPEENKKQRLHGNLPKQKHWIQKTTLGSGIWRSKYHGC